MIMVLVCLWLCWYFFARNSTSKMGKQEDLETIPNGFKTAVQAVQPAMHFA